MPLVPFWKLNIVTDNQNYSQFLNHPKSWLQ